MKSWSWYAKDEIFNFFFQCGSSRDSRKWGKSNTGGNNVGEISKAEENMNIQIKNTCQILSTII